MSKRPGTVTVTMLADGGTSIEVPGAQPERKKGRHQQHKAENVSDCKVRLQAFIAKLAPMMDDLKDPTYKEVALRRDVRAAWPDALNPKAVPQDQKKHTAMSIPVARMMYHLRPVTLAEVEAQAPPGSSPAALQEECDALTLMLQSGPLNVTASIIDKLRRVRDFGSVNHQKQVMSGFTMIGRSYKHEDAPGVEIMMGTTQHGSQHDVSVTSLMNPLQDARFEGAKNKPDKQEASDERQGVPPAWLLMHAILSCQTQVEELMAGNTLAALRKNTRFNTLNARIIRLEQTSLMYALMLSRVSRGVELMDLKFADISYVVRGRGDVPTMVAALCGSVFLGDSGPSHYVEQAAKLKDKDIELRIRHVKLPACASALSVPHVLSHYVMMVLALDPRRLDPTQNQGMWLFMMPGIEDGGPYHKMSTAEETGCMKLKSRRASMENPVDGLWYDPICAYGHRYTYGVEIKTLRLESMGANVSGTLKRTFGHSDDSSYIDLYGSNKNRIQLHGPEDESQPLRLPCDVMDEATVTSRQRQYGKQAVSKFMDTSDEDALWSLPA